MGQSFGYMTTCMTLLLGPEYGQFWTSCKFNNVLLIGIKSYIQFLLYKHNPWRHDQNWIVSVRIIFFRMVKSLQSMQAKTYTKGDLCRGLLSNLIFLGTPLTLRKSLLPSWLVSYHKKVYLLQAWSIEQNLKGVWTVWMPVCSLVTNFKNRTFTILY